MQLRNKRGRILTPPKMLSVGTPKKMSNEGRVLSIIEHLRPQAPPQVGTPDAAPPENQRFSPEDPENKPHPEIKDFATGTPSLAPA